MPRFIATHTLPMTEAEVMKGLNDWASNVPPGFSWKQTYCDFANHKFFCEWEAPSKEALEQGFKAGNLPFDAVYPVRIFDVAKKQLEP